MVISQTASGLTLTIKTNSYHFSRDGRLHAILESQHGRPAELRKENGNRGQLEWPQLLIKVTELSEQTNAEAGKVAIHPGITDVHTLTLFDDGRRLTDERTGYRAEAPTRLHGRPYQQSDDFAYRHQTAVFIRH
jgi:hypothetical protein